MKRNLKLKNETKQNNITSKCNAQLISKLVEKIDNSIKIKKLKRKLIHRKR